MSFYDLEFNDSRGNKVRMNQFEGKVVLIVNTATKCGLAPQFNALEAIYQKYKDKNFAVIGFPCNQFAHQEPESNETMTETCRINFGVTFLLSEKISVNGKETHPVFAYLKQNSKNGIFGKKIKWNFTKFLISSDGKTIKRYSPATNPVKIENDIIDFLK
ncbi:MAG TPA: glutathione peroxidase [Spirochaetota bacterium]|nr:glutathione peroxidase [Spirochaetota bacterium]HPJ14865.1 glutathione peroxidase [Spirochaetota bacterium]HPK57061.1 glutathione peroxidase [Spirochaetota bacterium]HPM35039.1 glutathione peroxidase [Spirochaetota bacterium]HQE60318.1 glutathione peroxidase [Spirochaetota bacterium]